MQLTAAERAAARAAVERDLQLSAADKKRAGVVHTPPELARFVARAANTLACDELGIERGFSDPRLAVIDPACGPGAFIAAAAAVARGGRDVALPPPLLHGFDRDPSAIAAAHAALDLELEREGISCALSCRDTLSDALPAQVAELAPALCVLGNPPWVASAQARPSPWLSDLLDDFRRDAHGARLQERKLGVLSDAYVRFVRWACEVARNARRGAVVALVTNASYLDGPVHRGMRGYLLREFDALHVIDLGGSALLARGTGRDDNVFGVRPAVAIALLVRGAERGAVRGVGSPQVRYARIMGSRADKLAALGAATLSDLAFSSIVPAAPYQRLVPTGAARDAYGGWPSLADAMPFHREGVQTNRDRVVIDVDRSRLIARLRAFAQGSDEADLGAALRALPHYDPERARAAVRAALARAKDDDKDEASASLVRPLAYRPFDTRWFVAVAPLCHRPRPDLLRAIDGGGLSLVSTRKDRGAVAWAHVAAVRAAPDNCFLSARSSCRTRAFPSTDDRGGDNLSRDVAGRFAERIGYAIGATAFIEYALAVLSSARYRQRHDELLRIDYPRIPWPRDAQHFEAWRAHGERLAQLWCEPVSGPAGALRATSDEPLRVDCDRCELRRGRRVVCAVGTAALEFRVGHHRLLSELQRSSVFASADDATAQALCARVDALSASMANLPADPW